MRQLSRKERIALNAAAESLERHPELYLATVEDYGQSRALVHDLRELLERRVNAASRHPEEPGSLSDISPEHRSPWGRVSRSDLGPDDGLGRYGDGDHTGFGSGCVY